MLIIILLVDYLFTLEIKHINKCFGMVCITVKVSFINDFPAVI